MRSLFIDTFESYNMPRMCKAEDSGGPNIQLHKCFCEGLFLVSSFPGRTFKLQFAHVSTAFSYERSIILAFTFSPYVYAIDEFMEIKSTPNFTLGCLAVGYLGTTGIAIKKQLS